MRLRAGIESGVEVAVSEYSQSVSQSDQRSADCHSGLGAIDDVEFQRGGWTHGPERCAIRIQGVDDFAMQTRP